MRFVIHGYDACKSRARTDSTLTTIDREANDSHDAYNSKTSSFPAATAMRGSHTTVGSTVLSDLPNSPWFRRALVAALLLTIVALTFDVLLPFLVPLTWGGILAYVSWPLHQRIARRCGNRQGFAALVTTLLITVAIIVPVVWFLLAMR